MSNVEVRNIEKVENRLEFDVYVDGNKVGEEDICYTDFIHPEDVCSLEPFSEGCIPDRLL